MISCFVCITLVTGYNVTQTISDTPKFFSKILTLHTGTGAM